MILVHLDLKANLRPISSGYSASLFKEAVSVSPGHTLSRHHKLRSNGSLCMFLEHLEAITEAFWANQRAAHPHAQADPACTVGLRHSSVLWNHDELQSAVSSDAPHAFLHLNPLSRFIFKAYFWLYTSLCWEHGKHSLLLFIHPEQLFRCKLNVPQS